MTPDERYKLADWLARYKGIEILREDFIERELKQFGITYDAVDKLAIVPLARAPYAVKLRMRRKEEFENVHASHGEVPAIKIVLDPGNWRGILAVDLAVDLCHLLSGKYNPLLYTGTTLVRHAEAIKMIRPVI